MSSLPALRLIEGGPQFEEVLPAHVSVSETEEHSLHRAVPFPEAGTPGLCGYLIRKYTEAGQVVLDPFCGSGTTTLQAALMGRVAYGSDVDPLCTFVSSAKLAPADLAEVTLRLQRTNHNRPVDLRGFQETMVHFFHIETYRELLGLRAALEQKPDRVSRFIELMMLGILHGQTSGCLSASTMATLAFTPDQQAKFNLERRQVPEIRKVVPRILTRAAHVGRDGGFAILEKLEERHRIVDRDARDMGCFSNSSVDFVLTSPPLPVETDTHVGLWLKRWYVGVDEVKLGGKIKRFSSISDWEIFMNEFLMEAARVVKRRGRIALDLHDVRVGNKDYQLDTVVESMVDRELKRYFEVEGTFVHDEPFARLSPTSRRRDSGPIGRAHRVLILKRRAS